MRGTDLCISNHDGAVSVAHGNLRVALPLPLKAGKVYQPMSVLNVGRNGDSVTVLVEQSCGRNFRLRFTVAQLNARIANARGLVHHRAKRFAEAAVDFAEASELDPGNAMFATNLACAQALAGSLDSAVAVITKLAATNMP